MPSPSFRQNVTATYQLSWGTALLLVFTAFALLMATMVYKAVHTQYDLVTKDYYAQELRHQCKIDAIKNVARLGTISINATKQQLQLSLPINMHGKIRKGSAWLYCPTDAKKDMTLPLVQGQQMGIYIINITDVTSGNYIVKTSWQFENRDYYWEKSILIVK